MHGRFINAGQACVSPDYVIVHESQSTELIEKMVKNIQEYWKDGRNVKDYGKIIN